MAVLPVEETDISTLDDKNKCQIQCYAENTQTLIKKKQKVCYLVFLLLNLCKCSVAEGGVPPEITRQLTLTFNM